MKQRKHWWIWLIVAAYIYFIFNNSLMNAGSSNHMSFGVTYQIMDFLKRLGLTADFEIFHHYIRKLAHFSEFALLGFLVTLSMHMQPLFSPKLLNFILFWFGVPFSDEMLQNFSDGRSCQFTDMLIDASGFICGAFVCYVCILIIKDLISRIRN